MTKPETEMCPCCGYEEDTSNFERYLCSACFFVRSHGMRSPDEHRSIWALKWQSVLVPQPKNWNPINTLARLALKITRAKTKGRPPRMNPNL